MSIDSGTDRTKRSERETPLDTPTILSLLAKVLTTDLDADTIHYYQSLEAWFQDPSKVPNQEQAVTFIENGYHVLGKQYARHLREAEADIKVLEAAQSTGTDYTDIIKQLNGLKDIQITCVIDDDGNPIKNRFYFGSTNVSLSCHRILPIEEVLKQIQATDVLHDHKLFLTLPTPVFENISVDELGKLTLGTNLAEEFDAIGALQGQSEEEKKRRYNQLARIIFSQKRDESFVCPPQSYGKTAIDLADNEVRSDTCTLSVLDFCRHLYLFLISLLSFLHLRLFVYMFV